MRKYTREDVDTHRLGYGYGRAPAVNVKNRNHVDADVVVHEFGCSQATAEKALEWAWESACEVFWSMDAPQIVEESFGEYAKFHSEGRSSGWLVVTNLPPIEEWDAIALGRWRSFENRVRREVDYLTSAEWVLDTIEANEWAEPEERDQNEVTRRHANALDELHS